MIRGVNYLSYRFAYSGMEKDPEIKGEGNSYTTEFRQYDPRLGRWMSLDPLMSMFPDMSPYVAFANNPIYYTDPLGLSPGPVLPDASRNVMLRPVNMAPNSWFLKKRTCTSCSKVHYGTDYPTSIGTPIKSTATGTVTFSGWHDQYGNVVVVDHGTLSDGRHVFTLYAHMSELYKTNGKHVFCGDVVGESGGTGSSATGPHLHYEVIVSKGGWGTAEFFSNVSKRAPEHLKSLINQGIDPNPFLPKSNEIVKSEPFYLPLKQVNSVPTQYEQKRPEPQKTNFDVNQYYKNMSRERGIYATYSNMKYNFENRRDSNVSNRKEEESYNPGIRTGSDSKKN